MDAYDDDEWKDSDAEEEESPDTPTIVYQPSYVLIAIDVDVTMFTANGTDHSAFLNCMDACFRLYNSLILGDRGSVKGPVSIILANNEPTKANFIDFEQNIPDSLKLLKELKLLSNEDLKNKYMRKEDFDLGDFFLFCKNKLAVITGDVYKKSVYYITNNDNPVFDAQKRFKIINESQKFAALQINLNVVTFKNDFDKEILYSEVLTASNSPPVELLKNVDSLTDEISNLVRRRYTKTRVKFYPFAGDTESYLDLVYGKFVKSANTVRNMYVTRDTQKEVKKITKKQLYTTEYACSYNTKLPPLIIRDTEKACLAETNVPVGLTLLHVSNENFKTSWFIERPTFVEKYYKETKILFDAFWQYCKDNSKCLVCLRKFRKGSEVRVVELVPRFINNKCMFLAKTYPFATDIHYRERVVPPVIFSEEEKDVMESLVDRLTFDYDPVNFSDPVEGKRRAYIKSQLLEEGMEKLDDGIPLNVVIDEQIHDCVRDLRGLDLLDVVGTEVKGKRSAAPRARSSKRGKAK